MKIILAGGSVQSLINFRGPMLRELSGMGHDVVATASSDDLVVRSKLESWGVRYVPVEMARAGMNPMDDWRYLKRLRAMFHVEKPHLVIAYTHKPVIYSALAAEAITPKPRVFALITGLGYAFAEGAGLKKLMAREMLRLLYKRASRNFSGVLFQNPDDRLLFRQMGITRSGTADVVVRGSGVEISHFRHEPPVCNGMRFILVARLLADKGLREYVSAARVIKETHPWVEFHLVGSADPANPKAIPVEEVNRWREEGVVIVHGGQTDVRPYLRKSSVFVLPSKYREGTPRSVLEAMAIGRAVITTDAPGCRETIAFPGVQDASGVRRGENGFLVPPGSVNALVDAMKRFVDDPDLVIRQGAASRRLAESLYDVRNVNCSMFQFMNLRPVGAGVGITA